MSLSIFQKECKKMTKEKTLTQERKLIAMLLYLPPNYIESQMKQYFQQNL